MTLLDKERDAIKTLAAYYDACNGKCKDCDLWVGTCLPRGAHLVKKRLQIL